MKNLEHVCSQPLPPIAKLVLVYRHQQPLYQYIVDTVREKYPDCEVVVFENWPEDTMKDDNFWKIAPGSQSVLVIDDMSRSIKGPAFEIICRGLSHHQRITVFYVSQDYASESKVVKDGLENCTYFILTKHSQQGHHLMILQKRLFPYQQRCLTNCFKACIEKVQWNHDFPYLIVDKNVHTMNNDIKTGIFPGEHGFIFELLE